MIRGDGWSFTHIPKTGGSSITAAIAHSRTGEWPEDTQGWQQKYHDQYAMHDGYHWVEGLKAFAFVRDPWEMYLSLWWYSRSKKSWLTAKGSQKLLDSFPDMMELVMSDSHVRHSYFRPFIQHITCPDTGRRVEFVGKYEHLQEDLDRIGAELGFQWDLPHYNYRPSNRPTVQEVYSETLATLVYENHAADCEEFGYAAPNL